MYHVYVVFVSETHRFMFLLYRYHAPVMSDIVIDDGSGNVALLADAEPIDVDHVHGAYAYSPMHKTTTEFMADIKKTRQLNTQQVYAWEFTRAS